ncbi:hypothetical protein D6764_01240, partial [Candidatus Woesearchaeota archaeon]
MLHDSVSEKLSALVSDSSPKRAVFASRGSSAIRIALRAVKKLGKRRVLIPDQGGWLTYEKDIINERLEPVTLKTRDGFFSPSDLKNYSFDAALLNSMPGYAVLLPMKDIAGFCRENNILLINDVSGSVGREEAKFGDIAVGSFGRWKPLSITSEKGASGGFLAFSQELDKALFESGFEPSAGLLSSLEKAISGLPGKISFWNSLRKKVVLELQQEGFSPLFSDSEGINVVVPFSSTQERDALVSFCEKRDLPFEFCPRRIRVLRDAVSIELKRI